MGQKIIEKKQAFVDNIAEQIKGSSSCIVVDYKGITVEEDTNLRKKFRDANITYKVYKNTLVRRAAEKVEGMDKFDEENLIGPNAFAFGTEDPMTPIRIIKEFSKNCPKLEMKLGYVEGEYYDAEGLEMLANIPSREVLIAKLLGSLKAPMSNFVYLVDAIIKKKEENGQEQSDSQE